MYYFAYGSNLSRKQMLRRCPDDEPKFKATLPDYKLIYTGRSTEWQNGGVASIKPFKGETVVGAIYEISEDCLDSLDIYEGFPTVYDRKNLAVFTESGEPVEAITYIKVEESVETPPSQKYLDTIQDGYRDWGIISE